jgi:HEAT repeat protein
MNELSSILLVTLALGQIARQSPTTNTPVLSADARAEVIRKGVIENWNADRALFDAVLALRPSAAPDIKALLSHPKRDVKSHALYLLSKMPEVGPAVFREALGSSDYDLRSLAVTYAAPLMKDPGVVDAFIECFIAEPRWSQITTHAIDYTLLKLDPDVLGPVAQRLIPPLLHALNTPANAPLPAKYDAQWTAKMIMLLGQIAEPADPAVLQSIAEARRQAGSRLVKDDDPAASIASMREHRDHVLEAALFAEANLGDASAFATYSNDIFTGPRELRVSHLRLLPKFRATKAVLDLTLRLLDDRTGIDRYGPVHSPWKEQRRTCDFAIDALGHWFPELAQNGKSQRIYQDDEIAKARSITQEAIRKLPEGTTTRPRDTSAWIELPATKPATQPATKPATQ